MLLLFKQAIKGCIMMLHESSTVQQSYASSQDMFDAVILMDGGEEARIEVELAMREWRSRKRHWFVHEVRNDGRIDK